MWSEDKIETLYEYQNSGLFHPYTCPGDYEKCNNHRNLIPTKYGWVCQCGLFYQEWSHIND